MQAPTLSDEQDPDRITLREPAPDDASALAALWADEQVRRWLDAAPDPSAGPLFVVESADDTGTARCAGQLWLREPASGGASLGFALAPWARGRGVMSRAVRLALDWAFTDESDGGAGLAVVHWSTQVGNWAARRVAWACGIRVEGSVRGLCEHSGTRQDGWLGSIVGGDERSPTGPWLDAAAVSGPRVGLRPWSEDDAARVTEACADPLTQHWLPGLPAPYTLADAQWYLRSREEEHARGAGVYWCVADQQDDRCLGSLAVMSLLGPLTEPEIGYWMHPDARGQGRMGEAVRLAVRHALLAVEDGGLGFDRVVLRAAQGNAASRAVARSAGMHEYGVARGVERLADGSRQDLVLYELLADDLLADEPAPLS